MPTADDSVLYERVVRATLAWVLVTLAIAAGLTLVSLLPLVGLVGRLAEKLLAVAFLALAVLYLSVLFRQPVRALRHVLRCPGYPQRHWIETLGMLRSVTACEVAGLAVCSGLTAFAVLGPSPRAEMAAVVATGFDAIYLCLLPIWVSGASETMRFKAVVPYFRSRVDEIDTFCHGAYLARHTGELDELARQLGVTPLSSFGWDDDMFGGTPVWHDASAGLKTVDTLLAHVAAEGLAWDDHAGVVDDLKRIAHALSRAAGRGIGFCLLLHYWAATNGLEWEQRRGTCF